MVYRDPVSQKIRSSYGQSPPRYHLLVHEVCQDIEVQTFSYWLAAL